MGSDFSKNGCCSGGLVNATNYTNKYYSDDSSDDSDEMELEFQRRMSKLKKKKKKRKKSKLKKKKSNNMDDPQTFTPQIPDELLPAMTLAFSNDNPNKTSFTYTPAPAYDIGPGLSLDSNILNINQTSNITYISNDINIERSGEESPIKSPSKSPPKSTPKSESKHSRNLSKEDFMTEGFIAKHQQRYSLSNPQQILNSLHSLHENTTDDESSEEQEIFEIQKRKKKLSALKQSSNSVDAYTSDNNDISSDTANNSSYTLNVPQRKSELFRGKSIAKWSNDDIKKQEYLMAQQLMKLHKETVSHETNQIGKQIHILKNNNDTY